MIMNFIQRIIEIRNGSCPAYVNFVLFVFSFINNEISRPIGDDNFITFIIYVDARYLVIFTNDIENPFQ